MSRQTSAQGGRRRQEEPAATDRLTQHWGYPPSKTVASTGSQSWIKDPEIDAWYAQQARERNRSQRDALLHKIQQKLYDEARFIPIWDLGDLGASGPRVAVSGLGLIPLYAFSGPYEDVQLKP